MKKNFICVVMAILATLYTETPIGGLYVMYLWIVSRRLWEYLEGELYKRINRIIISLDDENERIIFLASLSKRDLYIYFSGRYAQDELLLDMDGFVLIHTGSENFSSDELRRASVKVYETLMKFREQKNIF